MSHVGYCLAGLAIFALIFSLVVVSAIWFGRWWTARRPLPPPPLDHPDGGRRGD